MSNATPTAAMVVDLEYWNTVTRQWEVSHTLGSVTYQEALGEWRRELADNPDDHLRVTCSEGVLLGKLDDPTELDHFRPDPA